MAEKKPGRNEREKDGQEDAKASEGGQPVKKKNWRRWVRRTVFIVLLALLALLLGVGIWFYARYGARLLAMKQEAARIVAESNENTFRQVETSLVYDIDGNILSTLKGEKDVYYIDLADIPDDVIEAIISMEDKSYYRHRGLDLKGIARATWALIENKGEITQGASTITQQLARNIFLTHEETWERKVKEILLAVELEKKYSKAKIMEFYLNNIYFANGYYGIQAASYGYFDRGVQELTLSEQAFLCAIPNSPNLYDPYLNMENTLGRRDRILNQMELDGKLAAEEAETAKRQEIVLCRKEKKKNNYMETFAYDCAIRALMEREGFYFRYEFDSEEEEARYMELYNQLYSQMQLSLYTGGYRIYTSLDQEKQEALQQALDEALSGETGMNENGVYELQGAAVAIDNDTGRVAAVVGGRSQELSGYTLNRAFQSYRQPGSAIKPLLVYTPVFERGYSPEDKVADEKKPDGPRNVDGVYSGEVSILRAVAVSKNTVAWDLFEELTPARGLSYLLNMNFSRITENDYYPAASLGGLSVGVSPLEMTSGFAALENDGVYREPTCIRRIMDSAGNVLISEFSMKEERIYEMAAVEKMNRCLSEVMETGTGRRGRLSEMPCYGKTGTTNAQRDKWFVGYTAYYTTGIWVGYDLPRTLEALPAETEPLLIWKNFMEPLHAGKEPVELPAYVIPEPEEPEEEPDDEDSEEGKDEEPIELPDVENPEELEDPEDDWEDGWEDGFPDDEEFRGDEFPEGGNVPDEPEVGLPDGVVSGDDLPDDLLPDGDVGGEDGDPDAPGFGWEDLSPEDYEFFYGQES